MSQGRYLPSALASNFFILEEKYIMGLWRKVATNKAGKGFKSSRWCSRVEAKTASKKLRRREDKREVRYG